MATNVSSITINASLRPNAVQEDEQDGENPILNMLKQIAEKN